MSLAVRRRETVKSCDTQMISEACRNTQLLIKHSRNTLLPLSLIKYFFKRYDIVINYNDTVFIVMFLNL